MEDALLAGIMPEQFWALTPKETVLLLQGHYARDAQMAMLLAATINANRDPKKGKPVTVEDVSVFRRKTRMGQQAPEQQAKMLRTITQIMGGKVVKRHG